MKKSRTEITIETRRLLVVRRGRRSAGLLEDWCARCGKEAMMLFLDKAALDGVSGDRTFRHLDEKRVHVTTSADGILFICIYSLLEQNLKGDQYDETREA